MQIDQRCAVIQGVKRAIISDLQKLFHERNHLVKLLKTALEKMPSDAYIVVIKADKTPSGKHARRFNAPFINEFAIVMVGLEFMRNAQIVRRSSVSNTILARRRRIPFQRDAN